MGLRLGGNKTFNHDIPKDDSLPNTYHFYPGVVCLKLGLHSFYLPKTSERTIFVQCLAENAPKLKTLNNYKNTLGQF